MGQKVNPHGLRVGVIKDWDSRWFVKDEELGDTIVADYKLRGWLKEKIKQAGVPKIEIERSGSRLRVIIYCAKPGIIIGKGGAELEKLKAEIKNFTGNNQVAISVIEVKQVDTMHSLLQKTSQPSLKREFLSVVL